jgi:hypothetical protein
VIFSGILLKACDRSGRRLPDRIMDVHLMAKFTALAGYCREQTLGEFELSFIKIEAIIGEKLPDSALRPQYWANVIDGTGPVRSAMKDTPYETFLIAGSRRVRFERKR